MSRGLSGAMLSAIAGGTVYPILFGYFNFSGGAIRVCTHDKDVSWDSQTWTGLGSMVGVEAVAESKDVKANGIVFSLNGIPSSLITEILTNRSRGRECSLWFGSFVSGSLVANPHKIFSGRMDQPVIEDNGETCNVSISAEGRLVDLQRSRERRFTHEDQQVDYPGDLGLEYVAGLQNREVNWGTGKSATNNGATATTPAGVSRNFNSDDAAR